MAEAIVKQSYRQAIQTAYLGPTNHRGGRVKASCDAGSITVEWDHALDIAENHQWAARALIAKLGWLGVWTGGSMFNRGYVFVQTEEPCDD